MYAMATKAAHMPSSCWGVYRQVAVVELEGGYDADDVTMISERAKAVRRIVKHWDRLNVGKTSQCAYERAKAEAQDLCARLNDRDNS